MVSRIPCGRWGGRVPDRWAGLAWALALALVLSVLLAVSPPVAAQGEEGPEAGTTQAVEWPPEVLARASADWIPALTGTDLAARLEVLNAMRLRPELAREVIWRVLDPPEDPENSSARRPPPPRRAWRLVHHLTEFGEPEDIPRLLEGLERAADERERALRIAVARGLYPHAPEPLALEYVVSDFVFIQTGQPEPFDTEREHRVPLDGDVFHAYHRAQVPIEIIARLRRLRGKDYPSVEKAAAALSGRLEEQVWNRWQAELIAPLAPLPPRVRVRGLLRVRLDNAEDRPLLVRIDYGLWHARFESKPGPAYAYTPAGGRALHDRPVTIVAPLSETPVRMDLRLWEVHQAPQPLFRKLYLRLQP